MAPPADSADDHRDVPANLVDFCDLFDACYEDVLEILPELGPKAAIIALSRLMRCIEDMRHEVSAHRSRILVDFMDDNGNGVTIAELARMAGTTQQNFSLLIAKERRRRKEERERPPGS